MNLPSPSPDAKTIITTPWRLDRWSFWLGILGLLGWLLLVPGVWESPSQRLLGVWLLTILWWITEPIPISVTGLLAVALCFFLGIPQQTLPATAKSSDALKLILAPFGEPSMFFLMGGMFLGQAMHRHGLDRRFALAVLCAPGMSRSPLTVLFSVGLSVASISMFISNTAATAIVFPVVLKILDLLDQQRNPQQAPISNSRYGTAMLLITAYASSVGGISTPIGTTTNIVAMGYFKEKKYFGEQANFLNWMLLGVPLMIVLFGLLFLLLSWYGRRMQLDLPALKQELFSLRAKLGPWKQGEVNTMIVFCLAIGCWLLPSVAGLIHLENGKWLSELMPEELVALMIPVLLFILPAQQHHSAEHRGTLHSEDIGRIDWSSLLLFGAGLALGRMVKETKLADEFAQQIANYWPQISPWGLIAVAALAAIVLSEFSSNVAAVQILIPIIWSLCQQYKIDPLGPMVSLTLAASFGSALPVSTPPNTLIYSSGRIPLRRMAIVGIAFDVLCWVVVTLGVGFAVQWGWHPWLK